MCPSRAPPKTRRELAAQHWSYPILATEVLTSIAKTMVGEETLSIFLHKTEGNVVVHDGEKYEGLGEHPYTREPLEGGG